MRFIRIDKGVDEVAFSPSGLHCLAFSSRRSNPSLLLLSFLPPPTRTARGLILTSAPVLQPPAQLQGSADEEHPPSRAGGSPAVIPNWSLRELKRCCVLGHPPARRLLWLTSTGCLFSRLASAWQTAPLSQRLCRLWKQQPEHQPLRGCSQSRAVAETKHVAQNVELGSQVSAALPDVKRGSQF